jgi:hypothetical protein
MKEMLKYKSTIKARSFLYLEMKKASNLYLQGFSIDEIKQKALEENIFLLKTESRIKEIASTIEDRMRALDDFLISKIAQGNLETSKQITLYSILKTDRLFFEFMQEVYCEKYLLMDYMITNKDFSIFFQRKAEQNQRVASWKDYTYYKLEQVYKRTLLEAGFARKSKTNIEITKPIMEKDIIDYLKGKGDDIYIKAMLGEM